MHCMTKLRKGGGRKRKIGGRGKQDLTSANVFAKPTSSCCRWDYEGERMTPLDASDLGAKTPPPHSSTSFKAAL